VIYEDSMGHSRDYVYVTDAVRALTTVAFERSACGEVFNMAPAAHRTTLELVEEMIDQAWRACERSDQDRANAIRKNGYEVTGGVDTLSVLRRQHCAAPKLAALGFRNLVSISDGLRRTISSFMRDRGIGRRTFARSEGGRLPF
jgi:dTDP-D-glucose 4,6-dehydratase